MENSNARRYTINRKGKSRRMILGKLLLILKLMRPKHYLKNALDFVCVICTKNLFDWRYLRNALFGFAAFCLMSSAVYIFNDIRDVESDRAHHKKKNRPVASGDIKISTAAILFIMLIIASVILNAAADGQWKHSLLYLSAYLILNIAYSVGLKNIPLLDVAILVSGFLIRVLYGAAIIQSVVSHWLYLTVMAASLYLGLGKRRNELMEMSGEAEHSRKVLGLYSHSFLDKNMYMSMALAIIFYALWSVDPYTAALYSNQDFVLTVPLVIMIAMKYSLNVERASFSDPVEIILNDRMLMVLIGIYVLLMIGIVYYPYYVILILK
jgi:4-hydroxybenzoate polyprenyltransferase